MGAAKGSLANAVGSMYVRQYFQEDAKQVSERERERHNLMSRKFNRARNSNLQSALEMVHDIRAEFDAILDEIEWMDPSTKARAKAKGWL